MHRVHSPPNLLGRDSSQPGLWGPCSGQDGNVSAEDWLVTQWSQDGDQPSASWGDRVQGPLRWNKHWWGYCGSRWG